MATSWKQLTSVPLYLVSSVPIPVGEYRLYPKVRQHPNDLTPIALALGQPSACTCYELLEHS